MKTIPHIVQVFDPAMCCSTGVCGPDIDPTIVQFASDLDWLKSQGMIVQRHNLAQNPAAFAENATVKAALTDKGEHALPMLLIDGKTAFSGRYPDRAGLAVSLGLNPGPSKGAPSVTECCSPDGGCC